MICKLLQLICSGKNLPKTLCKNSPKNPKKSFININKNLKMENKKLSSEQKAEEILNHFAQKTNKFFAKDIALMYVDTVMQQDQYKDDLKYWAEVSLHIKRFF